MLSAELRKMKTQLECGKVPPLVDWRKIAEELRTLDNFSDGLKIINESLGLSSRVCKACGRPLP